MTIKRLQLGRSAQTPALSHPGIVLSAAGSQFSLGNKAAMRIHGSARLAKQDRPQEKKELAAGIFITAVEAFRQVPVCANMIQDHVLFEDDVIDTGQDIVIHFDFNLMESLPLPQASFTFFVHASFFQHYSNTLIIQLQP
jgi:hypothetical protein